MLTHAQLRRSRRMYGKAEYALLRSPWKNGQGGDTACKLLDHGKEVDYAADRFAGKEFP